MLDGDFVNTPEEREELEQLTLIGVDITRPLEEQSKGAQLAYWAWVRDHAIGKLYEIQSAPVTGKRALDYVASVHEMLKKLSG